MKLKALQEKEKQAITEFKKKASKQSTYDQIVDENEDLIKSAEELNKIIKERSTQETSIVITNLPPLIKEQSSTTYLQFCSKMTSDLERVLFI